MSKDNIRKILFITLSNIGDVILTLPVLTALKDNFPDAKIDVVVGPRPKDVFSRDPGISKVFSYDKHMKLKQKLDFIKQLRKEHYDLAIDMKTSLIPFLAGAKNRTSGISLKTAPDMHKKSIHLNKLKKFGFGYKEKQNIYIDQKDRDAVRELLRKNGVGERDVLIGISADCRSRLKEWEAEKFAEIIERIAEKKRYKIILIGDGFKPKVSGKIKNIVKEDSFIDLIGKTDLNQLFALIERLTLLLTCDSACMHIACDIGVKVLALFGPTDVAEYGPTGKGDIVIHKDIKCAPCKKAICRFKHECMKEIGVEEVLQTMDKLLD